MYLGIDVSKLTIDCCLITDSQNHQKKFQNNKGGFEQLIKWLKSHKVTDKLHCVLRSNRHILRSISRIYLFKIYNYRRESTKDKRICDSRTTTIQNRHTRCKVDSAILPRPKAQIKGMATAAKRTEAITRNRPIFRLSETATRNRKSQTTRSTRLHQIPYSNNYFKPDSTNTDS